jgi:hypothetical protein
MNRAVVAFLDGRHLKGYLFNFSVLKESFRLFPNEPALQQSGSDIFMKDLKAIFFVTTPFFIVNFPCNSESSVPSGPRCGWPCPLVAQGIDLVLNLAGYAKLKILELHVTLKTSF